jgi:trk system potassium uptake protein TrkH
VGLIYFVDLIFRLIGRQVTLGERLAVTSSLGLDRPEEIASVIIRAIGLMLSIEAIGAILLFLHSSISGIVLPGKAIFYSIFHLVTASCNADSDLFNVMPEYPNETPMISSQGGYTGKNLVDYLDKTILIGWSYVEIKKSEMINGF